MVGNVLKSSILVSMINENNKRIKEYRRVISRLMQENDILNEIQHEIGPKIQATMLTTPKKGGE